MKRITISNAKESELSSLIRIYRSTFRRHNIFQRKPAEIRKYLRQTNQDNKTAGGGYLVAEAGNKIVGGMLVRKEGEDLSGKHSLWRFNHLAVLPAYQRRGIGTALLKAGEDKIRSALKEKKMLTAKIELGVAENEKIVAAFYRRNGFMIEGRLRSHYRNKERVWVMGKEMKV